MNKYNWSNVPKEVKWIATDGDQWAWGWTKEPIWKDGEVWSTVTGFGGIYPEFFIKPENNQFKGNWQDSLEERPND